MTVPVDLDQMNVAMSCASAARVTVAGEIVSTGTCRGHCFVARGDEVRVNFGDLGVVEAVFE